MMALDLVGEKRPNPFMIRMIVRFSKRDPGEAEVLLPCFYSISLLQFFIGQFFILNRFLVKELGTVLIGMPFSTGHLNSLSSTSCF